MREAWHHVPQNQTYVFQDFELLSFCSEPVQVEIRQVRYVGGLMFEAVQILVAMKTAAFEMLEANWNL